MRSLHISSISIYKINTANAFTLWCCLFHSACSKHRLLLHIRVVTDVIFVNELIPQTVLSRSQYSVYFILSLQGYMHSNCIVTIICLGSNRNPSPVITTIKPLCTLAL